MTQASRRGLGQGSLAAQACATSQVLAAAGMRALQLDIARLTLLQGGLPLREDGGGHGLSDPHPPAPHPCALRVQHLRKLPAQFKRRTRKSAAGKPLAGSFQSRSSGNVYCWQTVSSMWQTHLAESYEGQTAGHL